jgi:hypothetical protein
VKPQLFDQYLPGGYTTTKDILPPLRIKIKCYRRNAMEKDKSSAKSARDIVMEYLQTADRRDFQSARGYLSDKISYMSPLNSFDRAEPYLKYFEHVNLPKLDIKKEFADSNDVGILHELNSQSVCTWFHVGDDRKISSIRVIFDP